MIYFWKTSVFQFSFSPLFFNFLIWCSSFLFGSLSSFIIQILTCCKKSFLILVFLLSFFVRPHEVFLGFYILFLWSFYKHAFTQLAVNYIFWSGSINIWLEEKNFFKMANARNLKFLFGVEKLAPIKLLHPNDIDHLREEK